MQIEHRVAISNGRNEKMGSEDEGSTVILLLLTDGDLGGGDSFEKKQKSTFSLRINAIPDDIIS